MFSARGVLSSLTDACDQNMAHPADRPLPHYESICAESAANFGKPGLRREAGRPTGHTPDGSVTLRYAKS